MSSVPLLLLVALPTLGQTVSSNVTVVTLQPPTPSAEAAVLAGYLLIDALLLCGAAIFAGLTLSVMGLDTLSLEIIASSGKMPDRAYAKKLLPIRTLGNQLLCTLILGNVMVNTLIAQITDRFVSGWIGTLVSTALITLGGEVLPQATMSAHALKVGASSAPLVRMFTFLFYPICKPLAMFLDRVIGSDPGQVYDRNELRKLIAVHARLGKKSGLQEMDATLMIGAMDLHDSTVGKAMTPLSEVFMLEVNERLNEPLVHAIWEEGHSRIPVYRTTRANVVGVMYAKDLLMIRTDESPRVQDLINFYPRSMISVDPEAKLISLLKEFQTGSSHIGIVRQVTVVGGADPKYETIGFVTLDDVIERLIKGTILDEYDHEEEDEQNTSLIPTAASALAAPAALPAILPVDARRLLGAPGSARGTLAGPGFVFRMLRKTTLTPNQLRAVGYFLSESVSAFKEIQISNIMPAIQRVAYTFDAKAPNNARGLPDSSKANVWLYRAGVPSKVFTLIVSGRVEITVRSGGSLGVPSLTRMELPSWSTMGTSILQIVQEAYDNDMTASAPDLEFLPDFDARVVQSSTLLQISAEQFCSLLKAANAVEESDA